ncbi:hypothetical protein LQW54_010831 [Pestalotiopsis sp. IQ-011]
MNEELQSSLTVTFENVNVEVHGVGEDFGATCTSVVLDLLPFVGVGKTKRPILHDVSGQVRPGEMLLVLGRPGSGCTSLLKVISNQGEEFEAVSGNVQYGTMGPREAKNFRDQIVMNTEDDAPLQCWDNSTRGLDASNALDFAKVLRKSADEHKRSIIATLYQAGNGIFNQFDKVLVLAEAERSTMVPRLRRENTLRRWASNVIPEPTQFQIIWGDRWSNGLQLASSLVMGLVAGSLFYNLSDTSTSIFARAGAIFYPILVFGLNSMSQTTASFMGRRIISRHKQLGFNRPGAYALACTITDIPLIILFFTIYEMVFYFMVGFQYDAGKFFTNWFILVISTLCFSAIFRTIGSWCTHFGLAAQISGCVISAMMVYTGYLIPFPSMHVWFRWIAYLNPAYYAFSAALASEMGNRNLDCVGSDYIPFGQGYDTSAYRSCTVAGTDPGSRIVNGETYLETRYLIGQGDVWRNVGIIIAFWVFFSIAAAIGFEVNLHLGLGSKVMFARGTSRQESGNFEDPEKGSSISQSTGEAGFVSAGDTVFTFKNISYYVHHEGKQLQLLRDVSGFVKPGQLVALMGSSGAGKTTLMDVLAQRKDTGRIEGSIMVNGKPQGISFQRSTGYCEQNDVHEPSATVWESLLFSARLRQSYHVPDKEKQEYVRQIMDLLELTPLHQALIGSPGSGLSIEQRKRLTLATELVAKPSLLFLDEPTSGLDGQSAYEICRFMRKLSAAGQTIICTIHQPSATLFEAFDVLLLLSKGGRTTYFGPTGRNSSTVVDYFAQRGAPCPSDANPAEHIVDVVQGRFGAEIDWPGQWFESQEREKAMDELDRLGKIQLELPKEAAAALAAEASEAELGDFATPVSYQTRLVTQRQCVALWRNPEYVWNKIGLHITNSLFGGFTFWMIGNGSFDLQLRLMAIFHFVFVAPGCINQLQPVFIQNRDIFETREKKSKTYHWFAFIAGQLISEIPVLIICGTIYFACWYWTAGFPVRASASGQVYLQMLLYEFLYTSIGQAIAAYSPDAYFAALANPIVLGAALVNFCGVIVPYSQIQPFWRYWMYYLDPFTYLVGGILEPISWDVQVDCKSSELTEYLRGLYGGLSRQ